MLEPEERVPETRGNVTRVPGGLPTGIDFLHSGDPGPMSWLSMGVKGYYNLIWEMLRV